jgi:ankyrin repeat protein
MEIRSFISRLLHFNLSCLATLSLIMLACNIPAFCGEIHEAARSRDTAKIKALLKDNPGSISSSDSSGNTPLHCALLPTPWMARISKDLVETMELLLANKADVNAKTKGGWTVLHLAARDGNKDVVELLLTHKADVNAASDFGITPLHLAAREGHKDVAELLLANKAKVNIKDNQGDTPLHSASFGGSYDEIIEGEVVAVVKSNKDVVELLLAKGGDINAKNNKGDTPLEMAAEKSKKDVVELLRQSNPIHDAAISC